MHNDWWISIVGVFWEELLRRTINNKARFSKWGSTLPSYTSACGCKLGKVVKALCMTKFKWKWFKTICLYCILWREKFKDIQKHIDLQSQEIYDDKSDS